MNAPLTFDELVMMHADAKALLHTFRMVETSLTQEKRAEGEAKLTRLFLALDREVDRLRAAEPGAWSMDGGPLQ